MSSLALHSPARGRAAPLPARRPLLPWRLPILGAILRALAEGDPDFPRYPGLIALCLLGCAVLLWGLPALVLAAVIASPIAGILLVALTRG